MAATKRYKLSAAFIFLMISISVLNAHAQSQTAAEQRFAEHKENTFREKIFVHINKSFYTAGEIVWFKIYCTNASNNHLAALSKVAYVELLDAGNTAAVQTMVALNNGTGNGSIFLPFALNGGAFRLRAYTSWMKNFDDAYFFGNTITVLNPLKLNAVSKPAAPSFDVQFMPEGGQLVQGINNRVAFKITGNDGKGAAASGAIVGRRGDTVLRFSTLKFGIGSFNFRPLANENYKAVLRVNNQQIIRDLPAVSVSGYTLQVMDAGDAWSIRARHSDSAASKPAYLILHNNYATRTVRQLTLTNGSVVLSVNKTDAEDGVNYITLFDETGTPVCERAVFKRPSGKLLINAGSDQASYSRRSKVAVTVSATNDRKIPGDANLSVSVFRADELQNKDADHISGYLWLKAALKGYIESPDYYLDNTTKEADAALDNLLLAQGWTQFDWSAAARKIRFLPEYTGPLVTARVINIAYNKPAADKMTYLTISGNPQQLYVGTSDSLGKVVFNTQNFYGQHELVLQTNAQIDSTYRVDLLSPYAAPVSGIPAGSFTINAEMNKAMSESSVNMQVQNIFTGNNMKQFYKAETDSSWFFGKPTKSYKLDDYTRFTTMEEVLREYVTSIAVAKHRGKFDITMFKSVLPLGNPLIMLDGIPVFDADKLFKWDPLKIKHLDVVSSNYVYGPALFNGIMSFITYKGDGSSVSIDPHAVVVDYEGLQMERKFYSPVYDTDALTNSNIPDFRTALYWNPDVEIKSGTGKSTLTFYTSDKPGQYIGIIEGIAADGTTGSAYFSFTVKK